MTADFSMRTGIFFLFLLTPLLRQGRGGQSTSPTGADLRDRPESTGLGLDLHPPVAEIHGDAYYAYPGNEITYIQGGGRTCPNIGTYISGSGEQAVQSEPPRV